MSRGGADARKSTAGNASADPSTAYWALFRLALPSILLQSGVPLAITVQTALLGRKDTQLVAAWAVVASEFAETWRSTCFSLGQLSVMRAWGCARGAWGCGRGAWGCARGAWGCARGAWDARAGMGMRARGMGIRALGMGMRARGKGMRELGIGMRARGKGMREMGIGMRARGKEMRELGMGMRSWGEGMRARGAEMRSRDAGMRALSLGCAHGARGCARERGMRARGRGYAHVGPATNAATVIFNFLVVGVTAKVTKVVAVGAWAQVGVRIRLAFAMAVVTSALAVALLLCSQGLLWALLRDSPSVLQYAKSYFYLSHGRAAAAAGHVHFGRAAGIQGTKHFKLWVSFSCPHLPFTSHFCPFSSVPSFQHVALVAWLQAARALLDHVALVAWLQAARALLDVAASYLSLYVLDWGIMGVGIGTFLASCTVAAVSFACILLLPPPQGKGKIVVFPPILSFLARKVAVPQVLLCRALSQRVSRTCSKVRVGGAASLADAQMLLLDGREGEGAGMEVGGIEERVLAALGGRMFKADGGAVSAYEVDQRPDGCGRGDKAGERDEQATRVGGREEEGRDEEGGDEEGRGEDRVGKESEAEEGWRRTRVGDATHSRMVAEEPENEGDGNAYNEDMLMGGDGRGAREGGCAECVEVRVVVGREETFAILLSKTGKEESVERIGGVRREKGGSGGSNIGERRGGEKKEGVEGKCKAEEMEEERVNELKANRLPSPVARTPSLCPVVQLSFFLVLACATSLGVHAVAAHQILMQLWMVNIYIADSFATAGTIVASSLAGRMAQARTRGEHAALLADLRLTCWRVLHMGLLAGILICAAYTSLERHIVALFTYDEATKAQLRHVWLFLALMQPLNSVVFVYDGLIYAAQAFSYMAACLAVGFFTLFLPVVCKCPSFHLFCFSLLFPLPSHRSFTFSLFFSSSFLSPPASLAVFPSHSTNSLFSISSPPSLLPTTYSTCLLPLQDTSGRVGGKGGGPHDDF
ncbi:unnamed protein product [Closterium sp. Naga37s-1]|nr:unnamed protein product [Closterium sp. Naga37s-1]